jgi:surfactin synthase thioesterase subunit
MFRELRKRPAPAPAGAEGQEFTCFFLHHAGGSSVSFMRMQRHFPAGWRLRAVELPGRGQSVEEPPCRDAAAAVATLAPAFLSEVRRPYALFGHSMGALIAFELARELQRAGRPPVWLGVSAMPAPGLVSSRFPDRRDLWSRERLTGFLQDLGGTPAEMLEDQDMRDYLVAILRNDLRIVDTYEYTEGPRLDMPLSVFTGADDPLTTPGMIEGWQAYCNRPVEFRSLPGGHFYLFEQSEDFARWVTEDIERTRETAQA